MKLSAFGQFAFVAITTLPVLGAPAFSQISMDTYSVPSSFSWDHYILKDDGSTGNPWEIGVANSETYEYRKIANCSDSGCDVQDMVLYGTDPKTGRLIFSDDGLDGYYLYDASSGSATYRQDPFSQYNSEMPRPSIYGITEVHIGDNSLVTREKDGRQELYASDVDGNAIPINITNGSDLQINGVSVQGQIDSNQQDIKTNAAEIRSNRRAINAIEDNVNDLGFGVAGATALSTAMTALPTVADDSPLSCGVGTGGYSSRYAMSVGCAVKATERLSFNAGGSYVFGGAADYGDASLSNVAGRAGFVFKLGEVQSSSKGDLQARVTDLEKANQIILEENASIKAINNDLMARLERLEAIASSAHTDRDFASR